LTTLTDDGIIERKGMTDHPLEALIEGFVEKPFVHI